MTKPRTKQKEEARRTHRSRAAAQSKALSVQEREIGDIPAIANPARRGSCRLNLKLYCSTYYPKTFYMKWSADLEHVAYKMQSAVLNGGTYAIAMFRGGGKTALSECTAAWATSYGHRQFVVILGCTEDAAVEILDSIKMKLETNDLLLADFPEICFPIRALEGIPHRCRGQLHHGDRTHIRWSNSALVLASIRDHKTRALSAGSAAIIRCSGLTGRIRGMKYETADGRTVRPDFVIPDDPQDDESARSVTQVEYREGLINGAVLGLAGPGKKISAVMPVTIIEPDDLAARMTDPVRNPMWQGERFPLLKTFPTNMKLWTRYREILQDSMRQHGNISDATAFYEANRAEMDAGASVSWPERFNHDEASAIQNAMNLLYRHEQKFWKEYQNDPRAREESAGRIQKVWITDRHNALQRGRVMHDCEYLTAFFDSQKPMIFWMVCGWSSNFTGCLVDYGTHPEQQRPYFTLRDANPDLARVTGHVSLQAQIHAGLNAAFKAVIGREYIRDDGTIMRVNMALTDAAWGDMTQTIYQAIRVSPHAPLLFPSFGRYVGAGTQPFNSWARKPGERIGDNWRIPAPRERRSLRHVLFDTNHWKSFVRSRLASAPGEIGCFHVFNDGANQHRLLADHLASEIPIETQGHGRKCEEWKLPPSKPDNHWLDCLTGCAVGASMLGCTLNLNPVGTKQKRTTTKRPRRRVTTLRA
jgi:hypothetical protein